MKSRILLFVVFQILSLNLFAEVGANETLTKVKANIENIKSFSYEVEYLDINPTIEDSVYKCSGNVWGIVVQTDSLFGCHFALKGGDENGDYEYYYDGITSKEVRHKDKEITIFNPHDFPNDYRNPAKARMALIPFQELLIDQNIENTLLNDNPKVTSTMDENSNKEIIVFTYPINEYNQDQTRYLYIDQSSYFIEKISSILVWNGAIYNTKINISNFTINESCIDEKIIFRDSYSNYTTKKYAETIKNDKKPTKKLLGKAAPNFNYKSYSGENISLADSKGKIVLLDFWETWCGWCLVALPKINELYKKYQGKDLQIIGITTENKEQIRKLINKNDLLYPNVYADNEILDNYEVEARPTYYLIDQMGNVALITYGDLEAIKVKIEELL